MILLLPGAGGPMGSPAPCSRSEEFVSYAGFDHLLDKRHALIIHAGEGKRGTGDTFAQARARSDLSLPDALPGPGTHAPALLHL